jgi:lysylphosphatidylglycerol synthetase-like protein (DUF2156 family)
LKRNALFLRSHRFYLQLPFPFRAAATIVGSSSASGRGEIAAPGMLRAHSRRVRLTGAPWGGVMELLLIVGVVLIILALLGFGGVISALRSAAWLTLVVAIVVIVVSFVF